MLTLVDSKSDSNCSGKSRRDFLCAGSLALGSIALTDSLVSNDGTNQSFVRDKSVILLYLSGGASHIETFDPKMDAPAGTRSVTGAVQTTIPSVHFGGTFPQLSKHANELAIVKSFQHSIGGHEQAHVHVLSGGTDPRGDQKTGYSMGSLVSRFRGANSPETGFPTYSLLTENEIDGQYRKELSRVRKGSWSGQLGTPYMPFEPGAGGSTLSNMKLNIPTDRLGDRNHLLSTLDTWKRLAEKDQKISGTSKFSQQAFDVLFGGSSNALDLSTEDPKLVAAYDTSHIQIGHKKFRKSTLGKQMLLARRLCESGCKFVTVHSAGWDMQADGNNPGMVKGMDMLGRTLDQALSAYLQDVKDRGVDKKILLVVTGDFGRTPKINAKGGRDHWAKLGPLAFAGGGLNMGQVIGSSDSTASQPSSEPITPANLMATLLHTVFDIGKLRLESKFPRPLLQKIDSIQPIDPLF